MKLKVVVHQAEEGGDWAETPGCKRLGSPFILKSGRISP